jgi:hypothetical protein
MTFNSATYLLNRSKYSRPQAILWSNNDGTLETIPDPSDPQKTISVYTPTGHEIGSDPSGLSLSDLNQFMILSDHNRGPLGISTDRIEKRERTINGKMRSYHIADKLKFDLAWSDLPSRSFSDLPNFNDTGKPTTGLSDHTVDGGAGGADLLNWYKTHVGPFYMFLAYDNNYQFVGNDTRFKMMKYYNEVVEVYISGFNYNIKKRGNLMDLWDITINLEEV